MSSPFLYIVFSVLGALIGHLTLKKDRASAGLGIGVGLAIGFAISNQAPLYLLAILIFAPLLYWRRRHVRSAI